MSIYCDLTNEFTMEDQLLDLFIDQLHQFAETYEENNPSYATSDFYWSSSSVG
jgi:hypothetical protein